MTQPKLLSVRDACRYLFGDFNRTLQNRMYGLLDANQIPRVKDGRKYYIPRHKLDELMERGS